MINRREILKAGILIPFLGIKNIECKKTYSRFSNIFETVDSKTHKIHKSKHQEYTAFTHWKYNSRILYLNECIDIPMLLDTSNKNDYYYGDVLLAAASDRNLIVYDKVCDTNIISNRLISMMRMCNRKTMKEKNSKIKHFFYKSGSIIENYKTELVETCFKLNGIQYHEIKESIWNKMTYLNYVTLPEGKKNILIGTTDKSYDFIKLVNGDKFGIAVLNNKKVILGAY